MKKTDPTLPLPLRFRAAWLAVWLGRVLQEQVDYLRAENQVLREKLGTRRVRLTDAERRRLATMGKVLGRKGVTAVATIASPETILRWYRELVTKRVRRQPAVRAGPPEDRGRDRRTGCKDGEREKTWGYTRLKGALKNLGYEVGRNTIKRILQGHGIDPAPERRRRMSWATFIKAHLGVIVGMGLFPVEAVTWLGLVRYQPCSDVIEFWHRTRDSLRG